MGRSLDWANSCCHDNALYFIAHKAGVQQAQMNNERADVKK